MKQKKRSIHHWDYLEPRVLLSVEAIGDVFFDDRQPQFASVGTSVVSGDDLIFGVAKGFNYVDSVYSPHELWRSDGTPAGTQLIKQMPQGNAIYSSSSPPPISNLTVVNGITFFTYYPGSGQYSGFELWKTDGTEVGTQLVKGFSQQPSTSVPVTMLSVGGRLYFNVPTGTPANAYRLWTSDGTAFGTKELASSDFLTTFGGPKNFIAKDSVVYFSCGSELWKTNGSSGTSRVIALPPGTHSPINSMALVNGKLLLNARDYLYQSDGTSSGTLPLFTSGGPQNVANLTAAGDYAYFSAVPTSNTATSQIWRTDGTTAGTTLIATFPSTSPSRIHFVAQGNSVFFTIEDGIHGTELWKTDGSSVGTYMVRDVEEGIGSSRPSQLTFVGNELYFTAYRTANGNELWRTDGSEEGTVLVRDLWQGVGGSQPEYLSASSSKLFFRAIDPAQGWSQYATDGTTAGTFPLLDLVDGSLNRTSSMAANAAGEIFVSAGDTTVSGAELYKFDGSSFGLLANIFPGTVGSFPDDLLAIGDNLFFSATDLQKGVELFLSNGSTAGTVLLKDVTGGASSSNPTGFRQLGGYLFFKSVLTLWKSDGTSAGTVSVGNTSSGSLPVIYNDELYWTNDTGNKLYKAGVSSTSFTLVKELAFTSNSFASSSLAVASNFLWFAGDDNIRGRELWKSGGTSTSTALVKDIRSNAAPPFISSSPSQFTGASGRVFFYAGDDTHGRELWVTDGSNAGTSMVKDIRPGYSPGGVLPSFDSNPTSLTWFQNRLIFTAYDDDQGRELWTSDGSEAGTQRLADLYPGSKSSFPRDLVAFGNHIYFTAEDGIHGRELWITDGTSEGTLMVEDLYPGAGSSNPLNLKIMNGNLYFTANDGESPKLFVLRDIDAPTVLRSSFYCLDRAPQVQLQFAEAMQALQQGAVEVLNADTDVLVDSSKMSVVYDAESNLIDIRFPGYSNAVLLDGNYIATVYADKAVDLAGNALAEDEHIVFFVLGADANHDRAVDTTDFNLLAGNFGGTQKLFSQGDFNYDAKVNSVDFNILLGQYGKHLQPPVLDASLSSSPLCFRSRPDESQKSLIDDFTDEDLFSQLYLLL